MTNGLFTARGPLYGTRGPLFKPERGTSPRLRRVLEDGQARVTEDANYRVSERNTVLQQNG